MATLQKLRIFVALAMFSLIAFCNDGRAQTRATQPKPGGNVVFASLKDIATTNPFVNPYSFDYDVRSLMFEGLTGLDIHGNVVPALAKSWAVSKDGLTTVT